MKPVIVPVAFGTTTRALATYEGIDQAIRAHFPEHKVHWAWSSRMARDTMKKKGRHFPHPEEVMTELADQGVTWAVVQSLHVIPGHEFQRLLDDVRHGPVRVSMGLPLLHSLADAKALVAALAPHVSEDPEQAILFAGHGTDHHAWTTYMAMEVLLRAHYGERVHVGVVEGEPEAETVIDRIHEKGFRSVRIVPMMLVAGVHYLEDLAGEDPESWKSLCNAKGIKVELVAKGIGYLPEVIARYVRHIEEAMDLVLR